MMNGQTQWGLIKTEKEYNDALARYEAIKHAIDGEENHKEKLLLVHFIAAYENSIWNLPEVDPVEMIKIRMEDFYYKATNRGR